MESCGIASEPDEKGGEEIAADQLAGDIIWVESRGNSWWPAQVVDENGVSGCLKPDNRLEGQILVRLYGSYTYVYADPVRCCSEFDIVLKQNNGCYREIFQKALEQDLLQLKSKKSRAQGSKSKDKKPNQNKERRSVELGSPSNTSTGGRITRGMKANMDPSTSVSHKNKKAATSSAGQTSKLKELKRSGSTAEEGDEKTPEQDKKHKPSPSNTEPSSRRVRVMQSLGLVAPTGSPFHAKRQTEF